MRITPDCVGNVIQLTKTAACIQIESVTDECVCYRQESGDHYATYDHEIEGNHVKDPNRIQEFARNADLGTALGNAEFCAIRNLLDGTSTREQRVDANAVLNSVRDMKKHLMERISQRRDLDIGKPQSRSLDSMISKANAEAKSQSHSAIPGLNYDFGR